MLIEWFNRYDSAIKALRIVRRIFPNKHFYIQNDIPGYWSVNQSWDYE